LVASIADAIPDHEAIVTSKRRLSWREFQLRTRRLANLLIEAGLGCRRSSNRSSGIFSRVAYWSGALPGCGAASARSNASSRSLAKGVASARAAGAGA